MTIKVPIELPDNWADEIIEKLKEDGTFVPLIHAHWIKCKVGHGLDGLRCSNCETSSVYGYETKFCPECGAKMDEEVNNEG